MTSSGSTKLMGKARSGYTQGRAWCFTVNNFSEDDVRLIRRLQSDTKVRYVVLQQEVASTGTNHLQGYIEFFRPRRLQVVRKLISPRVHWEKRCGTQADAIAYCKKVESRVVDGVRIEFGTPARSKISVDLVSSVLAGASMKDLALDFPRQFMNNSVGIKALKEQIVDVRKWQMEVIVFWGKTGTGKTFTAWQRWPEAYSVSWPIGSNWWWENYDGEETVICDEFASQVKLQKMLRFLDRTPFRVFYKGGSTQFRSKRIVLISNFEPKLWYSKCDPVGRDALNRRLVEFGTVYEFPERFRGVGEPKVVHDLRFEDVDSDSDGDSDSSIDFDNLTDPGDGTNGQLDESPETPMPDDEFETRAQMLFGYGMEDYVH